MRSQYLDGEQSRARAVRRIRIWFALIGFAVLAAIYVMIPNAPPPPVREPLTDAELVHAVMRFRATPPQAPSGRELAMARLGRKLFFDARFSANGKVSCATCHDPAHDFADGKPLAHGIGALSKNAPTVINSYMNTWFFWDGRADSLAAQALGPIEHPLEHGITRVQVVDLLQDHYLQDYEEAFGPIPDVLSNVLPEAALPPEDQLTLPLDVASYALGTLGDFGLMESVLREAEERPAAPAQVLTKRAFASEKRPEVWHANWKALTEEQRIAINQVFANFGRALEAYQKGLVAIESPFDHFAARVAEMRDLQKALDDKFGEKELKGLRIFAGRGQCTACHSGPNFTNQQFHNIGLSQRGETIDLGRATGVQRAVASPFNCLGIYLPVKGDSPKPESCAELPYLDLANLELVGAFKTPSLRNVARTGPYMHDGRFETLRQVLDHYNLLVSKPAMGHREETLMPLNLSGEELDALEAFLRSLTSPIRDLTAETVAKN